MNIHVSEVSDRQLDEAIARSLNYARLDDMTQAVRNWNRIRIVQYTADGKKLFESKDREKMFDRVFASIGRVAKTKEDLIIVQSIIRACRKSMTTSRVIHFNPTQIPKDDNKVEVVTVKRPVGRPKGSVNKKPIGIIVLPPHQEEPVV